LVALRDVITSADSEDVNSFINKSNRSHSLHLGCNRPFNSYDDSGPDFYYKVNPHYFQSNDCLDIPNENFLYFNQRFQEINFQISNHISNLKQYEEDWDEHHAQAFDTRIFSLVEQIIKNIHIEIIRNKLLPLLQFLPIPSLFPNSDGTIDITWRNSYLFLVIQVSNSNPIISVGKSPFLEYSLKIESESTFESSIVQWIFKVFQEYQIKS